MATLKGLCKTMLNSYASVMDFITLRSVVVAAIRNGTIIDQMDAYMALLQGEIKTDILEALQRTVSTSM